ncbi:MAG: hypothetical protein JSS02_27030 [Planctomycetes bacterium]|nr:hypothetical protein [Planctomycetota bacterium]
MRDNASLPFQPAPGTNNQTTYVIQGLSAGTYYFQATFYNKEPSKARGTGQITVVIDP